jgi:hypothetical protein
MKMNLSNNGIESGGQLRDSGLQTIAEAGLAPSIKHSANQVVCDRVRFGNQLVALLALPGSLIAVLYLFDNCGHFSLL